MFTMRDVLVEAMRREENMRRAEYGRFLRYAANQSPPHITFGTVLGRLLVTWGRALQAYCAARCSQPPVWKKVYYQL
jgi:hypothetical protein